MSETGKADNLNAVKEERLKQAVGSEAENVSSRFAKYVPKKTKMRTSASDKVISVVVYVTYALLAFVCAYPFYYIFINTISNNELSAKGKILFWPREIHFQNYVNVVKM